MQPTEPTSSPLTSTPAAHPLRRNAGVLFAALVALGATSGSEAYRSRYYGSYSRGGYSRGYRGSYSQGYSSRSRWNGSRSQAAQKAATVAKKTVNVARRAPAVDTGARFSVPSAERQTGGVAVVHESQVDGRVYAQPQSLGAAPSPASISEASGPSSVAVGVAGVNNAARKPRRPLTLAEQRVANHAMRLAAKQNAFKARQTTYQAKLARIQAQNSANAKWLAHAAPGQVVPQRPTLPAPPAPKPEVAQNLDWKRRAWEERQARYQAGRYSRYDRRPLVSSHTVAVKPRPVAKPVAKVVAKPLAVTKPVAVQPAPKPLAPVANAYPTAAPKFPVAAAAAVTAAIPAVAHAAPAPAAISTPAPAPVEETAPVAAAAPQPTEVEAPVAAATTDLESRPLSELHPEEKNGGKQSSGNVLVDVMIKLVSVVGLIGASAFGWKKLQGVQGRKSTQSLDSVQVISTAALGPQRFLHVVTVGQQRFLISSSPQQVSLIAAVDEGDISAAALASAGLIAKPEPLTTPMVAPTPVAIPEAPAAPAPKLEDDARYNDLLRQIRAAGIMNDPKAAAPAPAPAPAPARVEVANPELFEMATPTPVAVAAPKPLFEMAAPARVAAPAPVPAEARPNFATLAASMNAANNGSVYSMFNIEEDEAVRNA